jgi:glycosyltransferase involved in cell wall biosynthesis
VKSVLHVMNSLERSGMEMMLLSSVEEWHNAGYRCDVLATADAVGPIADQFRARGFRVLHIPFRSRHRYLPRARFVQEFFAACHSGYDIVHIHTETAPPVFAALARLAGVGRIAVTTHNAFRFSGALRVRKRMERRFVRMLGGRYGIISEGVRQCEWERFRNYGTRIWNWIDTSHFRVPTREERTLARREAKISGDRFVSVSVGNCNRAKNHEAILRAIALLPTAARPLHLHVGREQEGYPERKLAAELGIEDSVRFLGSQPDPLPYLWAGDAFLMPSLNEGLPLSAVEAVAAGIALVCANVEGLADIAVATKFTVLTDTTPGSVADALTRVCAMDPKERRARTLMDSQLVRTCFSAPNGVRSIVRGLYENAPNASYARRKGWIQS